jgi:hypothetical protein
MRYGMIISYFPVLFFCRIGDRRGKVHSDPWGIFTARKPGAEGGSDGHAEPVIYIQ